MYTAEVFKSNGRPYRIGQLAWGDSYWTAIQHDTGNIFDTTMNPNAPDPPNPDSTNQPLNSNFLNSVYATAPADATWGSVVYSTELGIDDLFGNYRFQGRIVDSNGVPFGRPTTSNNLTNPQLQSASGLFPVKGGDRFKLQLFPMNASADINVEDYVWAQFSFGTDKLAGKTMYRSTAQVTGLHAIAGVTIITWDVVIEDELGIFNLGADPTIITYPAGYDYFRAFTFVQTDHNATTYTCSAQHSIIGGLENYSVGLNPPDSNYKSALDPCASFDSGVRVGGELAGKTQSFVTASSTAGKNIQIGTTITVWGWK